jgi:hypothetical protein
MPTQVDYMLLFGAYDKQSDHVYANSGERQLNVEGQISHYINEEVPSLWLLYAFNSGASHKRCRCFADTF